MSRISFRFQSLKLKSHRQSLILLAVLIAAGALLVWSSVSNSSTTNEARTCEIVLNSRSAHPIDVTPTFYTTSGDAVVGNPIQLQPAEIRFVPVEQLMPEYLRGRHRWGGIALSYTGNVLEVWAQITFHGIGGGSIDETFNILEEPGSDTREAVWLMPRKSTAMIALGNSSSTADCFEEHQRQ